MKTEIVVTFLFVLGQVIFAKELVRQMSLEFPIQLKSLTHWEGQGSSVILTDKAILAPGIPQLKGYIHTTDKMPAYAIHEWTVDINFEVGNNFFKTRDTGGAVIYYLRDIQPAPYDLFGYSS